MNFWIHNPLLQDKICTARSSLLLLIACCSMSLLISNHAFAQYSAGNSGNSSYSFEQYYADIDATERGGGTWGDILQMNVSIQGSEALFTITSKKGPFYNTNSVSIRSGSHDGTVVIAGTIPSGSEAAQLRLNLDTVPSFPHRFFATITNDVGYAWVGYIQIRKNEAATGEVISNPQENIRADASSSVLSSAVSRVNNGPQRPLIDEAPERTVKNATINIAVTAGKVKSNDMVRVQCTASSSDNTLSNPYRSDWIYSGETIAVPLTFHVAGTQAIFCNTQDRQGETSSLSQRTIIVAPGQTFSTSPVREPAPVVPEPEPVPSPVFAQPLPPRTPIATPVPVPVPVPVPNSTPLFTPTPRPIPSNLPIRRRVTSTPAPIMKVPDTGRVNAQVSVKLTAGYDPQNKDLVRIHCTAEDSNRTNDDFYQSDWLPPKGKAKGTFVFYSPGEKNIYCTSYGRQGVISAAARSTISIRLANQAPNPPRISDRPYDAQLGEMIYIPVTAGSDVDSEQVRVKCSAEDSSITKNLPYISKWVPPLSEVNVALSFYTPGNKELTCITVDKKKAKSNKVTRKIHVHTPQYNQPYNQQYNQIYNKPYSKPYNTPYQQEDNQRNYQQEDYQQNNQQSNQQSNQQNNRWGNQQSNQQYGNQQYGSDYNFSKQSVAPSSSQGKDCPCTQNQAPSFSQQNRTTVLQASAKQPDLKGRVVFKSNQTPVQTAMVKILDAMSGRVYLAMTDYKGEFTFDFDQKNFTGQIQATKEENTSSIREMQLSANNPRAITLEIIDSVPTTVQSTQPRWPTQQTQQQQAAPAPAPAQWPVQQTMPPVRSTPAQNSVWQFN